MKPLICVAYRTCGRPSEQDQPSSDQSATFDYHGWFLSEYPSVVGSMILLVAASRYAFSANRSVDAATAFAWNDPLPQLNGLIVQLSRRSGAMYGLEDNTLAVGRPMWSADPNELASRIRPTRGDIVITGRGAFEAKALHPNLRQYTASAADIVAAIADRCRSTADRALARRHQVHG